MSGLDHLPDTKAHLVKCGYVPTDCRLCRSSFLIKDIPDHVKTSCPNRPIECRYCFESFAYVKLDQHLSDCKMFPTKCDKCDTKMLKYELDPHVAACPNVSIGCSLGCPHSFKLPRKDMRTHTYQRSKIKAHLKFAMQRIEELENKLYQLEASKKEHKGLYAQLSLLKMEELKTVEVYDVTDAFGHWYPAEIKITDQQINVSYIGWSNRFNETIEAKNVYGRVAPVQSRFNPKDNWPMIVSAAGFNSKFLIAMKDTTTVRRRWTCCGSEDPFAAPCGN